MGSQPTLESIHNVLTAWLHPGSAIEMRKWLTLQHTSAYERNDSFTYDQRYKSFNSTSSSRIDIRPARRTLHWLDLTAQLTV